MFPERFCWSLLTFGIFSYFAVSGQLYTSPANLYTYGPDAGDDKCPVNDDGSSGEIPLSPSFKFFGESYDNLYVDTNGLISFDDEVSSYKPDPFPLEGDLRMICVFWMDIDLWANIAGTVYYRNTTDPTVLARATADVTSTYTYLSLFEATWVFIATWYKVTYYNGWNGSPKSTFQIVLITNGTISFAMLNYDAVTFTNAEGHTPAQVGFNAGDGVRSFSVPGSLTPDIINVDESTNVAIPGRWIFRLDEATIESLPIRCALVIPHGSVNAINNTVGSFATSFSCDYGFKMTGSTEGGCTELGSWNGTRECVELHCGPLEPPINGSLDNTADIIDSMVTYSCNYGYRLNGSTTLNCTFTSNGIDVAWNEEKPTCDGIPWCGILPPLNNGATLCGTGFIGSVTQYSCNYGLMIDGTKFRTCTKEHTWSGEEPTCVELHCGVFDAPIHGTVNCINDLIESVATFTCDYGFRLGGSSKRHCLSDARWNGTEARCDELHCGSLNPPINGRVDSSVDVVDSVATYFCNYGFRLNGQARRNCTLSNDGKYSTWNGNEPTCEAIQCEPVVNPPPHGNVTADGDLVDSITIVTCEYGYHLTGSAQRWCTELGSWNGTDASCVETHCSQLSSPTNGNKFGSIDVVDAIITFSCEHGYNLSGSAVRNCTEEGTWTGEEVYCQQIHCGSLDAPTNGRVDRNSDIVDSAAKFSCVYGFRLRGSSQRTCLTSGSWDGDVTTCEAIQCETVDTPPHGNVNTDGNLVDSVTIVTCEYGYHLTGSAKRWCTELGFWNGTDASCVEIHCGALTVPPCGVRSGFNTVVDAVATFSCVDRLRLTGSARRRCTVDGTWDGTDPSCDGLLYVKPSHGVMLGGTALTVHGQCFADRLNTSSLVCKFDDIETPAEVLDNTHAQCVLPMSLRTDQIPVAFSVNDGKDYNNAGFLTLVSGNKEDNVVLVNKDTIAWGDFITPLEITWTPSSLNATQVDIDFVVFSYNKNHTDVEREIIPLMRSAENVGSLKLPVDLKLPVELTSSFVGALRVRDANSGHVMNEKAIWSEVHFAMWYQNMYVTELVERGDTSSVWTNLNRLLGEELRGNKNGMNVIHRRLNQVAEALYGESCTNWFDVESKNPPDVEHVTKCPCTRKQFTIFSAFEDDPSCSKGNPACNFLHRGATHCIRSAFPNSLGGGQQCCYDAAGHILPFENGGGTLQTAHYKGYTSKNIFKTPVLSNLLEDVQPYVLCCKLSDNCKTYASVRPTDDCKTFIPPMIGTTFGDPHIITMDDLVYTFNGLGEFWLIRSPELLTQGRATQAKNAQGELIHATSWTALAAKTVGNSSVIEVHVNGSTGLDIFVDHVKQNFDELHTQEFSGFTVIYDTANATSQVKFHGRVEYEIWLTAVDETLSYLIVWPHNAAQPGGLLGNANGLKEDEMQTPGGVQINITSTSRDVYEKFGMMWNTTLEESLFFHDSDFNYSSISSSSFEPMFEPPPADDNVTKMCGGSPLCIYDYTVTGKKSLALATAEATMQHDIIVESLKPVVSCGFIGAPQHGNKNGTSPVVGSTVTFFCNDGYLLEGSTTRMCSQTGSWDGTATTCVVEKTDSSKSFNWNIAVLLGVVMGGILVIICIPLCVAFLCRRRSKKVSTEEPSRLQRFPTRFPDRDWNRGYGPMSSKLEPPPRQRY